VDAIGEKDCPAPWTESAQRRTCRVMSHVPRGTPPETTEMLLSMEQMHGRDVPRGTGFVKSYVSREAKHRGALSMRLPNPPPAIQVAGLQSNNKVAQPARPLAITARAGPTAAARATRLGEPGPPVSKEPANACPEMKGTPLPVAWHSSVDTEQPPIGAPKFGVPCCVALGTGFGD
jgi:hypothetical protein